MARRTGPCLRPRTSTESTKRTENDRKNWVFRQPGAFYSQVPGGYLPSGQPPPVFALFCFILFCFLSRSPTFIPDQGTVHNCFLGADKDESNAKEENTKQAQKKRRTLPVELELMMPSLAGQSMPVVRTTDAQEIKTLTKRQVMKAQREFPLVKGAFLRRESRSRRSAGVG